MSAAADDDAAALSDPAKRCGHQRVFGGIASGARPRRAQPPGEVLGRQVAGAGEGGDPGALPGGDLAEDVRGGSKAVQPQVFEASVIGSGIA